MKILEAPRSLIQFNLESYAGKIRSIQNKFNILILAHDYRPKLGGIATASYELAKALSQVPGVSVKVLAPQGHEDEHGFFTTLRRPIHENSFLAIFQFAYFLRREVRHAQPDLILSTLWLPCSVATWLVLGLRLIPRTPLFSIVHGVEILESKRTFKKRVRSALHFVKTRVFKKSARILPVSRFTGECLSQETGIPLEKMKVIYNGVDPTEFFPRTKDQSSVERYGVQGKFVFLTLSRLEDYKGIDRFIEAMSIIHPLHPHAIYIVAGKGPDQKRLEEMVVARGLEHAVWFLGSVPQDKLNELYSVCDVFVLLSREDRITPNFEGLGIVLLEAGACGKPALAGRSGGIPEVVVQGETGWIVCPDEVALIAEAGLQAIQDPELVRRLGEGARSRVTKNFNWKTVAEKIVEEYLKNVRN